MRDKRYGDSSATRKEKLALEDKTGNTTMKTTDLSLSTTTKTIGTGIDKFRTILDSTSHKCFKPTTLMKLSRIAKRVEIMVEELHCMGMDTRKATILSYTLERMYRAEERNTAESSFTIKADSEEGISSPSSSRI